MAIACVDHGVRVHVCGGARARARGGVLQVGSLSDKPKPKPKPTPAPAPEPEE
jgi:hypothetical protein